MKSIKGRDEEAGWGIQKLKLFCGNGIMSISRPVHSMERVNFIKFRCMGRGCFKTQGLGISILIRRKKKHF